MSNPTGTLGKYQIIREIARSNDIVYEAYDPLMNRRVALKELAVPGGSTDPQRDDRIKRFHREAKAAGSLSHPNIVTIYEVGVEDGRHYLAMEFLDGHTLRNEMDTHGFLPEERAREIAHAILEGLEYAHQNGVVHRDVKPDNIQLLSDGRIKLTDFGIARLTFEPNLTMDGQVFGTPSYMSPEQVVGRDIDARSDLFSVGVVLYEMLSGQKPFPGDNVITITHAIVNTNPSQLSQVAWPLWQVIEKSLDKSPQLRYANAAEMIKALQDSKGPGGYQQPADPNYGAPPVIPQQPGSVNPYAPPVGNPYVGANPYAPQPTPYNPYGAQTTPYNPYAPPQANPYNPYAAPPIMQQQQPVGQLPPQFQIGNMPVQVYYPPPPRQPLLKPETKQLIAKVVAAVVIVGTMLFLVVLLLQMAFGGTGLRNGANSPSANSVESGEDANVAPNPEAQQKANLAGSFAESGTNSSDPIIRYTAWQGAAEKYKEAYDLEQNRKSRLAYGDAAAKAMIEEARALSEMGERSEAREVLYSARDFVPVDSDTYTRIQKEIESVS